VSSDNVSGISGLIIYTLIIDNKTVFLTNQEIFMMSAFDALKNRTSVNHIDPKRSLTDDEIKELVAYASEAPSSYNMQHWRFIAVRNKENKEKLKTLSYNQPKVADAAVTFIVLGDLKGHEKLSQAFAPLLKAGAVDQKTLDGMVAQVNGSYGNNTQAQRDEAIRSGSLAAMNLMTAATAKGFVSAPMIGFDPVAVSKEFGVPPDHIPVMLVAVGYAAPGNWPKKPRFPVDRILSFEKGRIWD
jgi:nitroreductase